MFWDGTYAKCKGIEIDIPILKLTKTKSIRGSDGSHSKFKPNGPFICSKGSPPRLEILNEPSRRSRKEALVDRLFEAGEGTRLRVTKSIAVSRNADNTGIDN